MNVLLTCLLLLFAPLAFAAQLALWLLLWPAVALRLLSAQRLGWSPRRVSGSVWLHGASLGEWNALLPLVERLGTVTCVGSYMSRNAQRAQVAKGCTDQAVLPLDLWPAHLLRIWRWRPRTLVIAEVDLWPAWLIVVWACRVELVWVNARLDRSMGQVLAVVRSFYHRMLSRAVYIHAVDEATEGNLRSWGYRVDAAGLNLKWARHGAQPGPGSALDSRTLLLASIHADESAVVQVAADWWRVDSAHRRVIVAPRQLSELPELKALAEAMGGRDWEFVDRYGIMDAYYRRAGIVVVGGTFDDVGGHNPVEAAVYGAAVVCGPSVYGQLAGLELLRRTGNVIEVCDAHGLREWLLRDATMLRPTRELVAVLGRSAELADTVAARVRAVSRYN